MNASDFVHLHVHSDYSLIDGAAKNKALAEQAQRSGHVALALTDHGSVSGIIDHTKACKAAGIKPIIGCEAYLAPGLDDMAHTRRGFDAEGNPIVNEKGKKKSFDYRHFTLIAKNAVGWKNLQRLCSIASLDGFYYRPRMSWALLTKHREGLIALSGCLSGQLSREITKGNEQVAEEHAKRWLSLFGDDYYMELMPAGEIAEQAVVNDRCLAIAKRLGIKPVATADIHYVDRSEADVQEIKICVNAYKTLAENRQGGLSMPATFYYKSTEEMYREFTQCPQAILNTREIAEKCETIKVSPGKFFMPKFTPPTGESSPEYFRRLAREGLFVRYGMPSDEQVRRLEYELACIEKLGFVDYFLVVHDFIDWARRNGVIVGPGRGSAAGSLVSYCLWITDIDPLRYGLLFERFLNPDRVSLPDIDIDFDERGRGRVIEYVKQKYGAQCVAQIITFGESKAKSAVKDVARVLEIDQQDAGRLTKLIPDGPKAPELREAVQTIPELAAAYEQDPRIRRLLDLACGYEGLYRNAGRHAAGIVIGDTDLMERVPLTRVGKGADAGVCTAFSMEQVEEVGLVKMDFLGLRTLAQVEDTLDLIRETTGKTIDPQSIPLRDSQNMAETAGQHRCWIHEVPFSVCRCCDKALQVLCMADTNGVFQVESSGMKKLLRQMKPDRFDDLIALVALFRPGPLGSGMDQTYVNRKNGLEPVEYDHPSLEPVLKETYGQFIYQEQLMQLSVVLAGFTLPQADELRKATAKKKADAMAKIGPNFIKGCVTKSGLTETQATSLWERIVYFSEYSFNKSHSAAYGLIGWRTAWLKANFPVEFMAALMTSFSGSTDDLARYVDEARRWGVVVEPPDVNAGVPKFKVRVNPDGTKSIIYGLEALKGVGLEAVLGVVSARNRVGRFRSFLHFCEEVDPHVVTKGVTETLAKAGAFLTTGVKRSQLLEEVERTIASKKSSKKVVETSIATAVRLGKAVQKDRQNGQSSLFADSFDDEDEERLVGELLPQIPEWKLQRILAAEKEALGLYLSGHPLDDYADALREYVSALSVKSGYEQRGEQVVMGGVVRSLRRTTDRSGKEMAFALIEDIAGTIDAVFFGTAWQENQSKIQAGRVLFFIGKIDRERDPPSLRVNRVVPLEQAGLDSELMGSSGVKIVFFEERIQQSQIQKVREILDGNPGKHPAFYRTVSIQTGKGPLERRWVREINGAPLIRQEIANVLGEAGSVTVFKY